MQNDELVVERKLRPIWDSIEMGNYKKALQDADKMLKKKPTLQCARALKAWAYLRLGRDDESAALITTLEQEQPTEATTLHALTLCYKEMRQPARICTLLNNAIRQVPGSEELLSQLFIAYMRIDNFKLQQTVALQLYKLRPRNSYYFWAVISLVLQALRGPDANDAQKATLLLTLAQRMVDKFIAENRLECAQEAQLYLQILQEQHKYREAYDFLTGALCQKLFPGAPVYLRIDLLKQLNRWAELNRLLKELLLQEQDRWDYYQDYIAATFRLIESGEKPDGTDHTVEMCHEFLCDIIEAQRKKTRGPYLARLELNRWMIERRFDEEHQIGKMADMLAEYFELFHDTPCCAHDMKLFLEYVTPATERRVLATTLLKASSVTSTRLPQYKEQMQRHICTLQIARYCGAHEIVDEKLLHAIYTTLSLHYEHGYNAYGKGLLITDMGPSDSYALLAAHIMYDRAWCLQRSEPVVEALTLLTYLLTNSPNNFHAKLLCLQLYHRLGLIQMAHAVYESLDIKHIQLDSLGYLHCTQLVAGGFPAIAKNVYERSASFFVNEYEGYDALPKASYNFGTYSKIMEIVDFRNRLANSLHSAHVSVEALLLLVVGSGGTLAQCLSAYRQTRPAKSDKDRIVWDKLQDNRDLTIFLCWDPPAEDGEENGVSGEGAASIKPTGAALEERREAVRTVSFAQEYDLLRLRSSLSRLVFGLVDLHIRGSEVGFSTVRELWYEWTKLTTELGDGKRHQPISARYLVNLLPSRLHLYLRLPYGSVFTHLGYFVLGVWQGCMDDTETTDLHNGPSNGGGSNSISINSAEATDSLERLTAAAERCAKDVQIVFETIRRTIDTYNESVDLLWSWKVTHEIVNGCVEILSLMVFTLAACHEYVQSTSTQSSTGGTKKAKKQTTDSCTKSATNNSTATTASSTVRVRSIVPEKERLPLVTLVLRELKQKINEADTLLASWKVPVINEALSDAMERLSLQEGSVSAKITSSMSSEVRELRRLLKDKLKMINKSI
ncbi:phagocyte signaling-impaired protein [Anopheles bellator]|uniref:phagocyte signaling-impaired protein n=1 Tax=Anopheles bellator TaxID=139047 RepID=UPI0026486513|nr:phagocyte signaling-impaired protein [Anopheles bellator]